MSKRGADGQGDKHTGLPADRDDVESPIKASAAQMAGRKIASTRSRRTAPASSFNPGSSLQAFGNPFAAVDQNTVNGGNSPSMSNSGFGQQQSGFSFGSPQPPASPSKSIFESPPPQSSSFPPAQPSGGSLFSGINSATGSFSFGAGAGATNPFGQSSGTSFTGFGQSNGGASQAQQSNGSNGDMQISPPATPFKGLEKATTPSIFSTMAGGSAFSSQSSNLFGLKPQTTTSSSVSDRSEYQEHEYGRRSRKMYSPPKKYGSEYIENLTGGSIFNEVPDPAIEKHFLQTQGMACPSTVPLLPAKQPQKQMSLGQTSPLKHVLHNNMMRRTSGTGLDQAYPVNKSAYQAPAQSSNAPSPGFAPYYIPNTDSIQWQAQTAPSPQASTNLFQFNAPPPASPQKSAFSFGQSPSNLAETPAPLASPQKPTFSFGQPPSKPAETPATSSQPSSSFSLFQPASQQPNSVQQAQDGYAKQQSTPSNLFAAAAPKADTSASSVSVTNQSSSVFQPGPKFTPFGSQPNGSGFPSSNTTADSTFKPIGSAPTPAGANTLGNDLFSRINKPSDSGTASVPPAAVNDLFSRVNQASEASLPAPNSNPFGSLSKPAGTPTAAPSTSNFNPFASPAMPVGPPAIAPQQAPRNPPVPSFSAQPGPQPAPSSSIMSSHASRALGLISASLSDAQKQAYNSHRDLRSLNHSFQTTLATANALNDDWSDLMQAYISSCDKILGSRHDLGNAGLGSNAPMTATKRKTTEDIPSDSSKRSRANDVVTPAKEADTQTGKSQTSNLFQSILDKKDTDQLTTPSKPSSSIFTPSTTPSGPPPAMNLFGSKPNDTLAPSAAPSSGLFAPKSTPQPPSSSLFSSQSLSKTAPSSNMFQSKATETTPSSNPFGSIAKQTPSGAGSLFTTDHATKMNIAPTSSAFKFKPAPTSSSTTDKSTFYPELPSFKPPPASANFLSQFGATAKSAESIAAEAKAKARAEEFDSEDDDAAEWERSYAEKLQKKKEEASAKAVSMPKFGAAAGPATSTNFMSQFGATATTAEQLAAEAKARQKAEEFDSEEDDEEEWERNYEEDLKKKKAGATAISVPKFGAAATTNFGGAQASSSKPPTTENVPKLAFTPAAAAGSSIFAASNSKPTSSFGGNIFGHLSNTTSDAGSDEDDDADSETEKRGRAMKKTRRSFAPGKTTADAPAEDTDDETIEDTMRKKAKEQTSSNSLFDRITPGGKSDAEEPNGGGSSTTPFKFGGPKNGASTPAKPANTSNIFGGTSGSPSGDHTWKTDSPIKFGGGGAPVFNFQPATPAKSSTNGTSEPSESRPFANLFNAAKPNPTTSLFATSTTKDSPAKTNEPTPFLFAPSASTPGSGFTSVATSRATSPGTAVESGNEDAEAPLAQSDFTALTAAELRDEEILFEVEKSRCSVLKMVEGKGVWETKGTGPLRVLRNRADGAVRVLLRIAPSGKVAVNCRVQKGYSYAYAGKGSVKLTVADASGKPETLVVKMKEDEEAKRFADVCEREKA